MGAAGPFPPKKGGRAGWRLMAPRVSHTPDTALVASGVGADGKAGEKGREPCSPRSQPRSPARGSRAFVPGPAHTEDPAALPGPSARAELELTPCPRVPEPGEPAPGAGPLQTSPDKRRLCPTAPEQAWGAEQPDLAPEQSNRGAAAPEHSPELSQQRERPALQSTSRGARTHRVRSADRKASDEGTTMRHWAIGACYVNTT